MNDAGVEFWVEALDEAEVQAELPDDKLEALTNLANRLEEMQEVEKKFEELYKQAKKNTEIVGGRMIPQLMQELGIEKIELKDGREVKLSYAWYGSANSDEAINWLVDHDLGDIIKNEAKLDVGKGDDPAPIVQWAEDNGYKCTLRTYVHPQTLRALLTEDARSGDQQIPHELFKVYEAHKTTVKT